MKKQLLFFAVTLGLAAALISPVRADDATPAPAKTLLTEAQHKAKGQKKAVLVMFHASW